MQQCVGYSKHGSQQTFGICTVPVEEEPPAPQSAFPFLRSGLVLLSLGQRSC